MSMITAYDYPFARMADAAGLDAVLVGDLLGMMVAGDADTLRVSLEQMEYHTRIVAKGRHQGAADGRPALRQLRGKPRPGLCRAARLIKAGADIVKLEGGAPMVETVAYLSARAIPVCAHIGLTPQHVRQFGGFKRQGKTPEAAARLIDDALALAEAGARIVLMEAIPADLATEITQRLDVPTIGIGAGPGTDGQVLVLHDVLGLNMDHVPGFARAYLNGAALMQAALAQYAGDVRDKKFPRKVRKEASGFFFEKKNQKTSFTLAVTCGARLSVPLRAPSHSKKVFWLLFVHKKKLLPYSFDFQPFTSRAMKNPSRPPRSGHMPGCVRISPCAVSASGSSGRLNGSRRRPSRAQAASIRAAPSSGCSEHTA